jgi:hypothetical protein
LHAVHFYYYLVPTSTFVDKDIYESGNIYVLWTISSASGHDVDTSV